jgi:small-conductance mechanosensitive channel
MALGLYWLAIIPSTPGSELVVALLALESVAIALASWRRIGELRRAPTAAGHSPTLTEHEHPGVISWLAGAALYVFLFWIIFAIVGRNDIVSVLFVGIALVLIARQWRRRTRVTSDIQAR